MGMDEFYKDTANLPLPAVCAYIYYVQEGKGRQQRSHRQASRRVAQDVRPLNGLDDYRRKGEIHGGRKALRDGDCIECLPGVVERRACPGREQGNLEGVGCRVRF